MIKPDEQVIRALAHVAQNVPAVKEWLDTWCAHETKRLPQVITNTAVAQGRCQVLQEITDLLEKAPEHVAQSREAAT